MPLPCTGLAAEQQSRCWGLVDGALVGTPAARTRSALGGDGENDIDEEGPAVGLQAHDPRGEEGQARRAAAGQAHDPRADEGQARRAAAGGQGHDPCAEEGRAGRAAAGGQGHDPWAEEGQAGRAAAGGQGHDPCAEEGRQGHCCVCTMVLGRACRVAFAAFVRSPPCFHDGVEVDLHRIHPHHFPAQATAPSASSSSTAAPASASSASTPAPAHSRVSTMVPGGGGDEEDLDIGGSGSKALECFKCKESHAAHMMCLVFMQDWQGAVTVQCFKCSKMGEKDFKQACRKGWRARRAGTRDNLRARNWREAEAEVPRLFGEGQRAHRARVALAATARIAARVYQSFVKEAPEVQKARCRALDLWLEEEKKIVADPFHVPRLEEVNLLPSEAADYLTQVVVSLDEYHICRVLDCGFFGLPTHWLVRRCGGQWACPRCTTRYQPWKKKKNWANCQKIMVWEMDDDDETLPPEEALPRAVTRTKGVAVQLVEWPDTATTTLINRFKEITAGVSEEMRALSPKDIVSKVQALTTEHGAKRTFWHRYAWGPEDCARVGYANAAIPSHEKQWEYKHLAGGYVGARFAYKADNSDTVMDMDEVVRLWAFTRALVKGAISARL